jgi:hypothetical protein
VRREGDVPIPAVDVILKHFESPGETRMFELGRFELVHIGGITIGRATYQPGWKWSQHVGPSFGLARCPVEHVGLVLAGVATAASDDGTVAEFAPAGSCTFPPYHMTAGSSGTSRTSRFISSAPDSMR